MEWVVLIVLIIFSSITIWNVMDNRHKERMKIHEVNLKRLEKGYPPIDAKGKHLNQALIEAAAKERGDDFAEYDDVYNKN